MRSFYALLLVTTVAVTGLLEMRAGAVRAAENTAATKIRDTIIAKERQELDCLKTGQMEEFAALISDDAVFLDPHGSASKKEVVETTSHFKLLDYNMEDVKFVPLSGNSGLIAYKLTQKARAGEHEFSNVVYASAVWAEHNGKWQTLFSQESPAR